VADFELAVVLVFALALLPPRHVAEMDAWRSSIRLARQVKQFDYRTDQSGTGI
jgi:hypothetical protein